MSLIVHHYFPLGSDNIGDHLVARALRQQFTRHFGPAEFVDMPVNDRYRGHDRFVGLRGENVDRSNAEADLVLVGGSNLLEPRKPGTGGDPGGPPPQWGIFTTARDLRRLRPPTLLVGMGTGSGFGKPIRDYQPTAREEIGLLFGRAFATSVRDVTTVERLGRIGVATECTGCPVTFLTERPVRAANSALPLLVSFPPSRIVRRFWGRRFMRGAMRYVEWLRAEGVPVVLTMHEARDREIVAEWAPRGVEVFATDDLDELTARFEASQGVIGFRLHAALQGLGLGKPVVPVGVDWRGLAFIETFGLGDLSIRPMRLGQFAKLRRLTRLLLDGDPRLIARLDGAKQEYLRCHESFFRLAASRFRQPVPIG